MILPEMLKVWRISVAQFGVLINCLTRYLYMYAIKLCTYIIDDELVVVTYLYPPFNAISITFGSPLTCFVRTSITLYIYFIQYIKL